MQALTNQAQQKVQELSQRYGVSVDAVTTLLQAVANGNGTMAQFSHYELGGSGQWMQGGMTMVGDMFNYNLKALVANLCSELSNLLATQPFIPEVRNSNTSFSMSNTANWWPADLGMPNGSGAQNNIRYAYFSGTHRLALEVNGQVTVYDTLDHQIGGVSQQQGGGTTLTFTSQYGTVYLQNLPIVSPVPLSPAPNYAAPVTNYNTSPAPNYNDPVSSTTGASGDIFSKIERLAELKQKGILSDDEFATKKAELLSKL